METALRIIGGVPFIVLVLVVIGWLLRKFGRPRQGRLLRLELVRSAAEVERRVGDVGDPRRAHERGKLKADFAFILLYLSIFIALAVVLAYRDGAWATWVAIAAVSTATLMAVLDVRENIAAFRLLDTPLTKTTDRMAMAVRSAALGKWALAAVTVALLSSLFWGDRSDFVYALGVGWALVAGLGVVAVVQPTLLPAFFVAQIGVIAITLALLVGWPETFLEGF